MSGVEDGQAQYSTLSESQLKERLDSTVEERVAQYKEEESLRGRRFEAHAKKFREAYDEFNSVKPDTSADQLTPEIVEWNKELNELERKAVTAESQVFVHKKSLEKPSNDVSMRRKARREIQAENPELYRAYEQTKKVRIMHSALDNVADLADRLDTAIESKSTDRQITSLAERLTSEVTRLEKMDTFKDQLPKPEKTKITEAKAKAQQIVSHHEKDRGIER